jgi:hypothetical protein
MVSGRACCGGEEDFELVTSSDLACNLAGNLASELARTPGSDRRSQLVNWLDHG